ncbi:MAG TPA: tetratricopeptide repeat protein, partial [Planctomycetaceae bacterium]|nr:tetratricopeptide repeat protein [Planctomycetaceae bacterium]
MHYQQALALALACSLAGCHAGSTSPTHLERAETALARGSLVDAQTSARAIAADDADWGRGQLVLAAVAQRSGDWQAALKHLDAVPDDASPESLFAAEQAIVIRLQQGQLHLATKSLQYLLNHRPDDVVRRQMLADLYTWTGQRRLADQQLGVLSKANALGPKQLVVYTDYDRRDPDDIKTLEQAEHHSPGDPAAQLGLAVIDLADGDRQRARKRLEQAVAAAPDLATAQAQLGELLVDESPAEFLQWYRQLPGSLREHPEIWYVRGLKTLQGNHPRLAADCFAQSAMATPTSYRMVYRYAL